MCTLQVDVSRSGSQYSGFTWTVTFATPRGVVPALAVNASMVVGDSVRASVVKAVNGSADTLWFNPIPAYLTQVPLSFAVSNNQKLSNGECVVC